MKTSLIIISTLLVLSVFVPFLLFVYRGTQQSSKITKHVKQVAKKMDLKFNLREIWRNNFISVSSSKSMLTYIRFNQDKPLVESINLYKIQECHIVKIQSTNPKNKKKSLQRLDLELVYKLKSKPNAIINFFEINQDLAEDYEIKRIKKWLDIIKKELTPTPESHVMKKAS